MTIACNPDYRLLIRVAIIIRRNHPNFRGTSHYSVFVSDIAFSRALNVNGEIRITNYKLKNFVKAINYNLNEYNEYIGLPLRKILRSICNPSGM